MISHIQAAKNYWQVAVQHENSSSTMGKTMIRTDLLFFATWKHKHHIKLNVKQRQTNAFSLETKHKTETRQKGKATTNKRVPEETQHKTEHTAKHLANSKVIFYCTFVWFFSLHSYVFVVSECVFFCLYVITSKLYVCCLFFDILPYVLSCVVYLLGNVCLSMFSFLLIWRLYFQCANNNHVVRIFLPSVVLFEFSFCTATCQ